MPSFLSINRKDSAKSIRVDNLQGKDYYIVPVVMLTEGVHNGNKGPTYYPPEELSKLVDVWNHVPVVVYHPSMNGNPISACRPDVLATQSIGIILNTKYDTKKNRLQAEAWIDQSLVQKIDNRVYDCIVNGGTMEVSTGLYLELKDSEGEWNGEKYKAIATNYQPDHLAVLPDQKGACSLADGAGLNVNQAQIVPLTLNMGYMEMRDRIQQLLISKLGTDKSYPYVEEIYDEFFIYYFDGKYWKCSYQDDEATDTVTIGDAVMEVKLSRKWVTIGGDYVGNSLGGTMNVEQLVAAILALNAASKNPLYDDADKGYLMSLNEERLKKLLENSKVVMAGDTNPQIQNNQIPPAQIQNNQNPPAQIQNMQEWLKLIPADAAKFMQNAVSDYERRRGALIAEIKAIPGCQLNDAFLNNCDPPNLEALKASLVANNQTQQQNNFAGTGFFGAPLVSNTVAPSKMEPIPVQNWDFSAKQ